jgi:hypothetical protein
MPCGERQVTIQTEIEVRYGSHPSLSPPTSHARVPLAFRSNGQACLPLGNRRQLVGCPAYAGVTIMLQKTPIIVGREVRDSLDQLHGLYGRDQRLPEILNGLNKRLSQARLLYGNGRSLPQVVSGLYAKLDKLRKLYGSDSIEEIVDDVIAWRLRFNRLVELQNKVIVSESDYDEMRAIQQQFRCDLERQRARRFRVQVVGS